jgi:hypothetical protein
MFCRKSSTLRCELDNRQNAELLPFKKFQPPKKIKGFYIFPIRYHPLHVPSWFFWSRIGHLKFALKPSILQRKGKLFRCG